MSEPVVIRAENLAKCYRISHLANQVTLRDAMHHGLRLLWRRLRWNTRISREEFWALRDVSFEVKRGEVVGIVGRNGAGKSTLLKILSRITEPTSGRVALRGRVASLLEVGTGFHPELTGRDNIFLNGAILGMTQAEVRRKFDEIVAFAEVERFLDTPVKRYSSGMYVRLAFAVAAHLEPEILIVDEVLAVGDVAFQKKCIGKMREVSNSQGRTVLFVSHNLSAVRALCSRVTWLDAGRLCQDGPTGEVLNAFALSQEGEPAAAKMPAPVQELRGRAHVAALAVETPEGRPLVEVRVGERWRVRVRVRAERTLRGFVCAVGFQTSQGVHLQTCWTSPRELPAGEHEILFAQDAVALAADTYRVSVGLSEADQTFQQFEAARFDVRGDEPQIYCPATAGYALVINSMRTEFRQIG